MFFLANCENKQFRSSSKVKFGFLSNGKWVVGEDLEENVGALRS